MLISPFLFPLTSCGLWFVSEAKPCVAGLMTTNRCYVLGGLSVGTKKERK